MENELLKRYANITRDVIMQYIRLCEECEKKHSKTAKQVVTQPIISNDSNSRCQVDLIDTQSQPDGEFRFIMVSGDDWFLIFTPVIVVSCVIFLLLQ